MARNINAINTNKYLGVNAPTPPNLVRFDRAPTANDYIGLSIGTIWVDSSVQPPTGLAIFMLMSVAQNTAVWVNFGGAPGSIQGIADTGIPVVPDINHDIFFEGGTLINTVGTANTLTFNLNQGLDGQIPIAATGSDTQYANLTSSNNTITITNTANGIDIVNNGSGGSSITVTTFDVSDTWTKGVGTRYMIVYGWSGGGGGGSGAKNSVEASQTGGSGGAWGSVAYWEFPAVFAGATESVVIGTGGTGGASQTASNTGGNNGGNSGVSSFGKLIFAAVNGASLYGSSGGSGGGFATSSTNQGRYTIPVPWYDFDTTRGNNTYTQGKGANSNGDATAGANAGYFSNLVKGNYLQGTAGGGGGGLTSTSSRIPGKAGGSVVTIDNITTVVAGGIGGAAIGNNGANGNAAATGSTSGGIVCGGTGGGGGASGANIANGGTGGNGGFPGGGGGGGGACNNSFNTGAGGNGAAGRIVVIEFA